MCHKWRLVTGLGSRACPLSISTDVRRTCLCSMLIPHIGQDRGTERVPCQLSSATNTCMRPDWTCLSFRHQLNYKEPGEVRAGFLVPKGFCGVSFLATIANQFSVFLGYGNLCTRRAVENSIFDQASISDPQKTSLIDHRPFNILGGLNLVFFLIWGKLFRFSWISYRDLAAARHFLQALILKFQ